MFKLYIIIKKIAFMLRPKELRERTLRVKDYCSPLLGASRSERASPVKYITFELDALKASCSTLAITLTKTSSHTLLLEAKTSLPILVIYC